MKKSLILLAAVSAAFVAVSCQKADDKVAREVVMQIPEEVVRAGVKVVFSDNSLDVQSRSWKFQDAEPSTSTDVAPEVKFKSAGLKDVTLEVVFIDGQVISDTKQVEVVAPVKGDFSVSDTTPMGCIRIGSTVKFNLKDIVGDPDTFEWSFEGGEPAVSQEREPSVKFSARNRRARVKCTFSRSSDKVSYTLDTTLVVGNYPMLRDYPEVGVDNYSFEQERLAGWIADSEKGINHGYLTDAFTNLFSIVEGGANGTGHCLKVDLTKLDPEKDGGFAFVSARDGWISNAHLEAGKKYELTYWVKGEGLQATPWYTGGIQIFNFIADWMCSDVYAYKVVRDAGDSGMSWSDVFPNEKYEPQNQELAGVADQTNQWWTENCQAKEGEWKQVRIEFEAARNCLNAYPMFQMYVGHAKAVYYDEIEINLLEE